MIGKILKGKYRIMEEVGVGPLTTVYLSRDLQTNRVVVLQAIHPDLTQEQDFVPRFRRQTRLLTQLDSPHIVKVLDSEGDEGIAFIALEYVEGKTLRAVLDEEAPLPVERALSIARQIAQALVDASAVGIAHGRLCPADILITASGLVKVSDFSLAAISDPGRSAIQLRPQSAALPDGYGKPSYGGYGDVAYVAPELAAGGPADSQADVYSLGAILFEMVTGQPPYPGDDPASVAQKHAQAPVPSARQLNVKVSPELDALIVRCLAKAPQDRYLPAQLLEALAELSGDAGASPGLEASLTGQTLGRYQLLECIGRGGMAAVYKAYQPGLDREVAVKVMPASLGHDPRFIARFKREARAIARLKHPNILSVHDFGQEGDLTYIVMQYVEGGTLKDLLGQPLSLDRAVEVISQVADALDHAHSQGIVHRDIKPSNVLMAGPKWALLSDFGLAWVAEASTKISRSGATLGTPSYMSPEQCKGLQVDARTDVYSLGVVLYEMLTGRVPYEAETPLAVLIQIITAPLPRPRDFNPSIPELVERVILKALAKDPADRFGTAGELAAALKQAVEATRMLEKTRPDLPPPIAPVTIVEERKPARSPLLWVGVGVLALALIACAVLGAYWLGRQGIGREAPPVMAEVTVTSVATATAQPVPTSRPTDTPVPPTLTPLPLLARPTDTPVPPTRTPDHGLTATAATRKIATADAVALVTAQAQETETAVGIEMTVAQARETAAAEVRAAATVQAQATAMAQAREAATAVARETATTQAMETATTEAYQTATAHAHETAIAQALQTAAARETAAAQALDIATVQALQTVTARETATAQALATATSQVLQTVTARETTAAQAQATAMSQALQTATAGETATAQAEATATAQTLQTATAQALATAAAYAQQTATAAEMATTQAQAAATVQALQMATAQARETSMAQTLETAVARARETAAAEARETVMAQARETLTAQPTPTHTSTPTATVTDTPPPTDTPTPVPTHTPTATPVPALTATPLPTPAPGSTWTRTADGMVMVYLPAGEFQMGSSESDVERAYQLCNQSVRCDRSWFANEKPAHPVALDSFWLDRTEVTNAQYRACVQTGMCTAVPDSGNSDFGGDEQPVVGVTWEDARSYCQWAEARLPTEAEWEYAAHGPEGRMFPWGDTFDGTRLNYRGQEDGYAYTSPVGSYPAGASWAGILDLAGNVSEWVQDWYGGGSQWYGAGYQAGRQVNPTGPVSGKYRALRGGSWNSSPNDVRTTARSGNSPTSGQKDRGFRCARSHETAVSPIGSATPAAVPTLTPSPTPCTDNAGFVADVTVPDNTVFKSGESFDKTWQVKNTGTCPWDSGYRLAFVAGDKMGAPDGQAVASTATGGTAEITVPMKTPDKPGTYTGVWQMVNTGGARFGGKLSVIIQVPSPYTPTPVGPKLGDTWTRPNDGMVMVYVPAGEFQMGSNDGADSEKPVHTVALDAFWIDKYEVSNAQYRKCVAAGACRPSYYADDSRYNGDQRPVVGVMWNDAKAYSTWAGGQLPTEAEWEYAARGPEERVYPWGNNWDASKANTWERGPGTTTAVGSYPAGASWCGALDMAGNVWEWVADWYDPGYYRSSPTRNPTGPSSGEYRVVRGGSWSDDPTPARVSYRFAGRPAFDDYFGFRCARDAEGAAAKETPTPTSLYPAPVLLVPGDGTLITDRTLKFAWTWDGQLGPDECFELVISQTRTGPWQGMVACQKESEVTFRPVDVPLIAPRTFPAYYWTVRIQKRLPSGTWVTASRMSPARELRRNYF